MKTYRSAAETYRLEMETYRLEAVFENQDVALPEDKNKKNIKLFFLFCSPLAYL